MQSNRIDKLLEEVNIIDIIAEYVPLTRKGNNFFGICPFHTDTNPSMSVNAKKGIYKCFSCGAGGNAITFIQKYKKIPFSSAIKEVAKKAGYTNEKIDQIFSQSNLKSITPAKWRLYNLNNAANEIFVNLLTINENEKALKYLLENRKISLKTINEFNIGYSSKENFRSLLSDHLTNKDNLLGENRDKDLVWNENELLQASLISVTKDQARTIDYFYHRIMFPIYDEEGFLVAFTGRTTDKDENTKYLLSNSNALFQKGKILYNLNKAYQEKADTLVIVEGNLDVLSLYESLNDNEENIHAVALMGTILTDEHIKKIRRFKKIILWLDNDKAGREATIKNGILLAKSKIHVVVVSHDLNAKDINDILVNFSTKKVIEVLKQCTDLMTFIINEKYIGNENGKDICLVEEMIEKMIKYSDVLYRQSQLRILSDLSGFGFDDLNEKYNQMSKSASSSQQKSVPVYKEYPISHNPTKDEESRKRSIDNMIMQKIIMYEAKVINCLEKILYYIVIDPAIALKVHREVPRIYKSKNLLKNYLDILPIVAENSHKMHDMALEDRIVFINEVLLSSKKLDATKAQLFYLQKKHNKLDGYEEQIQQIIGALNEAQRYTYMLELSQNKNNVPMYDMTNKKLQTIKIKKQ